jgi:hypothetical protein
LFPCSLATLEKFIRAFRQLKTLVIPLHPSKTSHKRFQDALDRVCNPLKLEAEKNGGPSYEKPVVTFMSEKDIYGIEWKCGYRRERWWES